MNPYMAYEPGTLLGVRFVFKAPALNPKPYKPETRNPKPKTLNPKP